MARFPWIQVTQETWGKARALGGVLGMSRREAFGLICDLWAWALEQGPDDRPPSGEVPGPLAAQLVAGAVEWTGDPALLVSALEACGLMARGIRTGSERDPNGVAEGLRVRGVDRYESTWKKNRMGGKKTQSERDPNGIRTDTARFPNAQTQTQTQTHREATTFAGASRAAPGQAPPRPEDHVLPAPTSGREDEPASPAQQPLLAVEVAPGQANGSEAVPGKPARKPRQKPAQEPKDPSAFVACRDMLVAVYEEVRGTKYGFEGAKDARAVSRLLELSGGDLGEVERRWRQALGMQAGYLRAHGIAHFASAWNAYPGASATGGFKPHDRGGRATHADKDWTTYDGKGF